MTVNMTPEYIWGMSVEDGKVPDGKSEVPFKYDPPSMPEEYELFTGYEVIKYRKSKLPVGEKVYGDNGVYAFYRRVGSEVVVGFEGDMDLAPD